MKIRNLLWLLLALLTLPASRALADDKISKETLESQGRKRAYYLFAPASAKSSGQAPLLLLLHGSGRNGLTLVEKWKELAAEEGIILAGPDSRDSRGWSAREDGPDFLRDLVEAVKARHAINPRRVYLFGHSAGAVFAINLSMMESEYFAAAAVHAGSWRTPGEFSVLDYARRKTPLAIFVGDRDNFFPLSSVKATEAALLERGFPVEVTVMRGHDHWYYDLAPSINRKAWDFLKRQELKEEPRYTAYNQTGSDSEVNAAITRINGLNSKANGAMRRFYGKEDELKKVDLAADRRAAAALAREQLAILDEIVPLFREAALAAGRLSTMKLQGDYARYFALLAEAYGKRAEAALAMRERAEFLLSDGPHDAVVKGMNGAAVRADRLNVEAGQLEQTAERVRTGRGR